MALKQFQNMTFQELDEFTNEWLDRTQDIINLFFNQAQNTNELFVLNNNNYNNLEQINHQLNVVKNLYKMIEQNINVIIQCQNCLSSLVIKIENETKYLGCNGIFDIQRGQVGQKVLSVHSELMFLKPEVDEFTELIVKQDSKFNKSPIELITKILMRQMVNLEKIELKLQHALNLINVLDCKKKRLLNSLTSEKMRNMLSNI